MKTLREKLALTVSQQPFLLPPPGKSAIIACSGGLDSMMLARLMVPVLAGQGSRCVLALMDHGWRPDDASREHDFVRDLAHELDAQFLWARRSPAKARVRAIGREAAAREQRRLWLGYVARKEQAKRIYLGHHRDDQLETILLRRAEGVPLNRAASMSPLSGFFTRPLLGFSKVELEAVALKCTFDWMHDPSNADLSLRRNSIRHQVATDHGDEDSQWLEETLAQGRSARAYLDQLQRQVDQVLESLLLQGREGDCTLEVSASALAELCEDVGILSLQRLCVAEHSCSRVPQRRALEPLLRALSRPGRARLFHLGAGWTARLANNVLRLQRGQSLSQEEATLGLQAALALGQKIDWPLFGPIQWSEASAETARQMLAEQDGAGTTFAVFDLLALRGPLHVRAAGIGLRFRPFGCSGTRKVRDLLAEAGVPRYQRANWPVVMDADGQVLWLPGVRSAANAALETTSTAAALLYTTAAPHLGGVTTVLRDRVS